MDVRRWRPDVRLRTRRGRKQEAEVGCGVLFVGTVAVIVLVAWGIKSCDIEIGGPRCGDTDDELIDAASRGDAATVRRELQEGADPNRAEGAHTALSCAIDAAYEGNDDVETVQALLDAGADPNEPLLVIAAEGAEVEIVEALLDSGARPTTDALQAAAGNQHPIEVSRLLLDRGVDPDGGPDGPSPLLFDAFAKRPDLVALLLEHGADPNHGGKVPSFYVQFAQQHVLDDTVPENVQQVLPEPRGEEVDNVPPLAAAAWVGDAETARLLLDAGADPNLASDEAFTPIFAAAVRGDGTLVDLLLQRGANPVPQVRAGVPTPAEAARATGQPDIATRLDQAASGT